MIYLVNENNFGKYEVDSERINFTLNREGVGLKLPLLMPSIALQTFWEESEKTDSDWEIVKEEYNRELREERCESGIALTQFYSNLGKSVFIGCKCENLSRCVLTLIADRLEELDEEFFLEGGDTNG